MSEWHIFILFLSVLFSHFSFFTQKKWSEPFWKRTTQNFFTLQKPVYSILYYFSLNQPLLVHLAISYHTSLLEVKSHILRLWWGQSVWTTDYTGFPSWLNCFVIKIWTSFQKCSSYFTRNMTYYQQTKYQNLLLNFKAS